MIRYIGGCCGFEPYLIRAVAEELAQERGCLPFSARKSDVDLSLWKNIEEKQHRHAGKYVRDLIMYLFVHIIIFQRISRILGYFDSLYRTTPFLSFMSPARPTDCLHFRSEITEKV